MRALLIRAYRLLLWLQPRDVRRRYGAEMLALVIRRTAESPAVREWIAELADLLLSAVAARKAALGWLLIASAAIHTAYAAYVYPHTTMGIGAVLLTASALAGGIAIVRRDLQTA